jgi:type IV pilus secretin PilQ/predicted competence protein
MRIMWRAWWLGALLAVGLILSNGTLPASEVPVVHVKALVKDGAVRLEAEANGPFQYTTYRPSESLYVLDLSGVSAADPAGARVVDSDLVKSYRVVPYAAGEKQIVRVEILLKRGVEPRLERKDPQDLTLVVSRGVNAASAATDNRAARARATAKPADANTGKPAIAAIRQVHLTENDGSTQVNIFGSGPLSYHSMRLHDPERLVLDFSDARLLAPDKHIPSNLDPVREVRMGQFTPKVSRVVIDLRQASTYRITRGGNTVTVAFAPTGSSSAAAEDAAPAAEPSGIVTTKSPAPSPIRKAGQSAAVQPADVPTPAAVLPATLTQSSAALAAPAPADARQQEAETAASNTANAASPTESASASPAATQAPVATGSPATTKYSGEPISVNLKDVDLRDFFRLIHEISGLNVVVDPAVKGSLTIVLDDVPWDQALDIVLMNNDLDKQLSGNVLRIATKQTLRREAEESRDLAKARAEAVDVVTTTRVLSYAKATAMAGTLKKFLSSRGDIIADDRSNTLIIRDIPSTLPVIDNLIRQLDRKSQQVEIEARVVAANRSFAREIGTQFGVSAGTPSGNNLISGAAGASPFTRNFPPLPAPPVIVGTGGGTATNGQIPLMSNLPVGSPTSGIAYNFSSSNFALDMIITAAENRGVGKLLSKPKIITQNNEKATVKQGTKIPVQTIVNNTVSVQFVDAVLELSVTPQITADGTIYMDVSVQNDQIDQAIPRVQGIPAIDTQSAETKVTVNDGATVVIGGIIVTSQRTSVDQVPFVGSIPLLGNLFKHKSVSSSSQELLFFLTPRILPS